MSKKHDDGALDIQPLAEVTVRQLNNYFKFILEHDLWDELESHLKGRGCHKLLISWEPIHAVATMIEAKPSKPGIIKPACASNGPMRPPGPKMPPPRPEPGDGGPGDR